MGSVHSINMKIVILHNQRERKLLHRHGQEKAEHFEV